MPISSHFILYLYSYFYLHFYQLSHLLITISHLTSNCICIYVCICIRISHPTSPYLSHPTSNCILVYVYICICIRISRPTHQNPSHITLDCCTRQGTYNLYFAAPLNTDEMSFNFFGHPKVTNIYGHYCVQMLY